MSGIAGIINFDDKPADSIEIKAMTQALQHRGPDGISHWLGGPAALGQCMLHTTPESLEERQPLTNEDQSLILVMDGRIDNWQELRTELLARCTILRDCTDAELVLKAYELWRQDCLDHLDGDFALVIWEPGARQVFCARDRMGNKPLYYHWDGKTFTFASEMSAILGRPWVEQKLNEGVLAEFLSTEWYSQDETLWRGVLRLKPAHRMNVDARGPKFTKYWQPDCFANLPATTAEEFADHYRDLITDVIKRMSRSHQTLAAEVSGGLDSSAIFAVAENLRQRNLLLAPSLEGFALAFNDDNEANELDYSRAVGTHLGRQINEIPPSRMPLSWYRERAILDCDFCSYPNGVMGLGIRQAARQKGARALLVGIGGDEWLGGSRCYYAEALMAGHWRQFMNRLRADHDQVGAIRSLIWAARHGLMPALPGPVRHSLKRIVTGFRKKQSGQPAWLTPTLHKLMHERRGRHRRKKLRGVQRIGQREQVSLLSSAFPILANELEERLAARAGIELRRPYLDHRIIQFAFSMPAQFRHHGPLNRYVHRQAMRSLLPDTVLQRQTKANFMVTFQWQMAEIEQIMMTHLCEQQDDWVHSAMALKLFALVGDDKYGGWPELMIWTLYQCLMLQDAHKAA